MPSVNPIAELNKVKYSTFPEITGKIQELSAKYGSLPIESLMGAFSSAGFYGFNNNPYSNNRRVKAISSTPALFSKQQVEDMLRDVYNNEKPLRRVHHALEYTSYPLEHTRFVYQNLLTYHNYTAPYLTNKGDAKRDDFWREWKLVEKLRTEFQLKAVTHEIVGQTLQEGKVFYYPRYSVDKAHNKVNHAFLQQLPSDYVKIVGYNNKSKYTLAFDLMYFASNESVDILQFGDLLLPYLDVFNQSINPAPKNVGTKLVYASKSTINLKLAQQEGTEVYYQNGRWFYWVTLPIDKVFTFEIDDVTRTAVSPLTGLIVDMLQLSQLESLQMELLANPLVSILHGEIPYFDQKDNNIADQYKLSNAGRMMFEALFYQMTQRANTGGIGLYAAPFEDMKLESLPEAPNATNIVSSGYNDVMNKAGLAGIIPSSSDARAGIAQISFLIESQFGKTIYRCMERMMNVIIESLNLKYDFRFHMFGDLATDEKLREETKKDMSLGLLPSTLIWDALHDRSIMEDIAQSDAVMESGLLDRRLPLVSSYTMSPDAGLPPTKGANPLDEGGRPEGDGVSSEGAEQDTDDSYDAIKVGV